MIEEIMLADTPVEQREQILRDSCDQIEERSYTKRFTQEDTNDRRAELASVQIQISNLEQELSEVKAEFKGKLKPLVERLQGIISELKSGGEYVTTDTFKFCYPEEKMVAYFAPDGHKIEQRSMRPEERARTVFQAIRKTGTED